MDKQAAAPQQERTNTSSPPELSKPAVTVATELRDVYHTHRTIKPHSMQSFALLDDVQHLYQQVEECIRYEAASDPLWTKLAILVCKGEHAQFFPKDPQHQKPVGIHFFAGVQQAMQTLCIKSARTYSPVKLQRHKLGYAYSVMRLLAQQTVKAYCQPAAIATTQMTNNSDEVVAVSPPPPPVPRQIPSFAAVAKEVISLILHSPLLQEEESDAIA